MKNRIILFLTLPLTAFIVIVSCVGLLSPNFYAAETVNWQAQSIGQDMIDLFLIAPCLLISSIFAFRNNKRATMIWGGIALYLTYTFVLYCFDVHFNTLFILYCLCLGLSFYSFVYFLFMCYKENIGYYENKPIARLIGSYFIVIALLFYVLWLSEIVPAAIQNKIPKSVSDAGLFTNGVHVLDLAIILPAVFIVGIFLLKRVPLGFMLAPVILTFFVLMDITIGILAVVMNLKGVESDVSLTAIMGVLTLVSLGLLLGYFKNSNYRKT